MIYDLLVWFGQLAVCGVVLALGFIVLALFEDRHR